MKSEIVLIGPIGAGKSTVGTLLSEKLAIPLTGEGSKIDYFPFP